MLQQGAGAIKLSGDLSGTEPSFLRMQIPSGFPRSELCSPRFLGRFRF